MTGFAADWLSLREPADHRARSADLLRTVAAALAGRERLTIVDLGCGTGSTARAVAGRLPGPQSWRLVDNAATHLEAAAAALAGVASQDGQPIRTEAWIADLNRPLDPALIDGADLIATSAFLDLVSAEFVDRLAVGARAAGALVYAALSVDGRLGADPGDADDDAVFAAFNAHMLGDKGFGAALGPRAGAIAAANFKEKGFKVCVAPADWSIGAGQAALASRLLDGWVHAVTETGAVDPARLTRWAARRRAEIAAGAVTFTVGHVDLVALPPSPERSQSNSTSPPSG